MTISPYCIRVDGTIITVYNYKPILLCTQTNGGFLLGIILLTQCYYSGNPFKCHEEVLQKQPIISPPNVLTFSPRLGDAQKV